LTRGPVRPTFARIVIPQPDGRLGLKTDWVVAASYGGPVLIRGARIDGYGLIGFGEQPVIGHLVIPPGYTVNSGVNGGRSAPGGTFVGMPGCYAWQIDGVTFSDVIVFSISRDLLVDRSDFRDCSIRLRLCLKPDLDN
jgi:hypothetical protein